MGRLTKEQITKLDEFGELDRKVIQFKPTADRHDELRKEILSWVEDEPADKPLQLEGGEYSVQVSARGNRRNIVDMARLFAAVGKAKFISLCSFPITEVERAFPDKSHHSLFLRWERTGSRKLTPVLKERNLRKVA